VGEKVYAANCVACHQANGKGIAGQLQGAGWLPDCDRGPKQDHIGIVLNGKPGTAMAAFAAKQLSDTDIAAVVTYERNAGATRPAKSCSLQKSRQSRK
jgi:cytochrome c oxidase subunit 2